MLFGLLILLAFLAIDLFGPPALGAGAPLPSFVLMGMLVGQATAFAVWGGVGPLSLIVRLPLCLVGAEAAFMLMSLVFEMMQMEGHMELALELPILLLSLQFPFWLLRLGTGCRIVRDCRGSGLPHRSRQFHVKDLLVLTAVVAVALGLARFGLSDTETVQLEWPGGAIVCGLISLWSGVTAVPCLYAAMVVRSRTTGLAAIAIYTVVATFLWPTIIAFSNPDANSDYLGGWLVFYLLFDAGAVLVLFGTLFLARSFGYVLLWPGGGEPQELAETA